MMNREVVSPPPVRRPWLNPMALATAAISAALCSMVVMVTLADATPDIATMEPEPMPAARAIPITNNGVTSAVIVSAATGTFTFGNARLAPTGIHTRSGIPCMVGGVSTTCTAGVPISDPDKTHTHGPVLLITAEKELPLTAAQPFTLVDAMVCAERARPGCLRMLGGDGCEGAAVCEFACGFSPEGPTDCTCTVALSDVEADHADVDHAEVSCPPSVTHVDLTSRP